MSLSILRLWPATRLLERILLSDECRADVSVLSTLPKLKEIAFRQNTNGRVYQGKDFLATYAFDVPEIKAAREALAADGVPSLPVWRVSVDEKHLLTLNLQSMGAVNLRSLSGLRIKALTLQEAKYGDLAPLAACRDLQFFSVAVPGKTSKSCADSQSCASCKTVPATRRLPPWRSSGRNTTRSTGALPALFTKPLRRGVPARFYRLRLQKS